MSDKVLVMPYCSNNRDDLTDEEYVKQAAERGETLIPMVLNRNARSFLIIDQPRLIARKMLRGYVGTLDVEAKLEKDTSYKGLWTVSFTLKEY